MMTSSKQRSWARYRRKRRRCFRSQMIMLVFVVWTVASPWLGGRQSYRDGGGSAFAAAEHPLAPLARAGGHEGEQLLIAIERQLQAHSDPTDAVIALEAAAKAREGKADRDLWTFGDGRRGQLGHGFTGVQKVPRKVHGLDFTVVMRVACGQEHMVAVSDTNNTYAWGMGEQGQLSDDLLFQVLKPRWSQMAREIKGGALAAFAGGFNSAVMDKKKYLYTFGWDKFGSLGRQAKDLPKPRKVGPPLKGKAIKHVSIGLAHTLALDEDGAAYSWGANMYGQLGDGKPKVWGYQKPYKIESLEGVKGQKVAAGCEHSLMLDEDGMVWSWGNGHEGQLGHGDWKSYAAPFRVDGVLDMGKAVDIAAGCHSSFAVLESNVILAWGWNRWGQLGVGDTLNRPSPRTVALFKGQVGIRSLAAGRRHTLALSDNGIVFCWGANMYGQCGRGERPTYIKAPVGMAFFDGLGARVIAAGPDFSAVITDSLFAAAGVAASGSASTASASTSAALSLSLSQQEVGYRDGDTGAVADDVDAGNGAERVGLVASEAAIQMLIQADKFAEEYAVMHDDEIPGYDKAEARFQADLKVAKAHGVPQGVIEGLPDVDRLSAGTFLVGLSASSMEKEGAEQDSDSIGEGKEEPEQQQRQTPVVGGKRVLPVNLIGQGDAPSAEDPDDPQNEDKEEENSGGGGGGGGGGGDGGEGDDNAPPPTDGSSEDDKKGTREIEEQVAKDEADQTVDEDSAASTKAPAAEDEGDYKDPASGEVNPPPSLDELKSLGPDAENAVEGRDMPPGEPSPPPPEPPSPSPAPPLPPPSSSVGRYIIHVYADAHCASSSLPMAKLEGVSTAACHQLPMLDGSVYGRHNMTVKPHASLAVVPLADDDRVLGLWFFASPHCDGRFPLKVSSQPALSSFSEDEREQQAPAGIGSTLPPAPASVNTDLALEAARLPRQAGMSFASAGSAADASIEKVRQPPSYFDSPLESAVEDSILCGEECSPRKDARGSRYFLTAECFSPTSVSTEGHGGNISNNNTTPSADQDGSSTAATSHALTLNERLKRVDDFIESRRNATAQSKPTTSTSGGAARTAWRSAQLPYRDCTPPTAVASGKATDGPLDQGNTRNDATPCHSNEVWDDLFKSVSDRLYGPRTPDAGDVGRKVFNGHRLTRVAYTDYEHRQTSVSVEGFGGDDRIDCRPKSLEAECAACSSQVGLECDAVDGPGICANDDRGQPTCAKLVDCRGSAIDGHCAACSERYRSRCIAKDGTGACGLSIVNGEPSCRLRVDCRGHDLGRECSECYGVNGALCIADDGDGTCGGLRSAACYPDVVDCRQFAVGAACESCSGMAERPCVAADSISTGVCVDNDGDKSTAQRAPPSCGYAPVVANDDGGGGSMIFDMSEPVGTRVLAAGVEHHKILELGDHDKNRKYENIIADAEGQIVKQANESSSVSDQQDEQEAEIAAVSNAETLKRWTAQNLGEPVAPPEQVPTLCPGGLCEGNINPRSFNSARLYPKENKKVRDLKIDLTNTLPASDSVSSEIEDPSAIVAEATLMSIEKDGTESTGKRMSHDQQHRLDRQQHHHHHHHHQYHSSRTNKLGHLRHYSHVLKPTRPPDRNFN